MVSPRELVQPFLTNRLGFPRVDWEGATVAFGENGALSSTARDQLVEGWLGHVVEARGPSARWTRHDHFHLVELPVDDRAQHALRWAHEIRVSVLRRLDGIARALSTPLPMLLFVEEVDYVDYHVDFMADLPDAEVASSGGMFLDVGCPHIAAPLGTQLESVLAHELTHALVHHLPLPVWLNEGFAVAMQEQWTGFGWPLTTETIADHRRLWNQSSIQRFWSGQAFHEPALQQVAYQLANVLVTRLAGNYDRLRHFATAATVDDAGASAFASTYGEDLRHLLEPLLGRGPWQPDPTQWEVASIRPWRASGPRGVPR